MQMGETLSVANFIMMVTTNALSAFLSYNLSQKLQKIYEEGSKKQ